MSLISPTQPQLLSRINERSVVRILQKHGPCSRAEVTRWLGVTAPTVSKAVASLLRGQLLEEFEIKENGRGRPAKQLRLASQTARVLGLVVDAHNCRLVTAGLNGELNDEDEILFSTPSDYSDFIEVVSDHAKQLMQRRDITTLGLGISMPGLIDYRHQKGILSPNVPITNGQAPAADLSRTLGMECVMLQETHALCLAERHYGEAREQDDFAMLDISTGVGLGVMSGGRVLTGHTGLAGEMGHIPLVDNGRLCGCGRRGCLETVASDSALAWLVSQRLGRPLTMDQVIELTRSGELWPTAELETMGHHLSFALSTVISLFNPATLYIYGRAFDLDHGFFDKVARETEARTLSPSFRDCRIVQARGSKRQGAISGIIEFLTDSLAPQVNHRSDGLFAVHDLNTV